MTPDYVGKIEYCYSNSTAMMLRSVGEQIDPSLIEVMTGMGIGAHMSKSSGELFFDCSEPDIGIGRALTNLGFSFDEANSEDPTHAPFDHLRELLRGGPVVLGPLELAKLTYNPSHGSGNSDHYILAYNVDDTFVYVHDPWGFPCARITFADLELAWRAEAISYKRGYFRHWSNPRRIEQPTEDELHARLISTCKEVYTTDRAKMEMKGKLVGAKAIRALADSVGQQPFSRSLVGFFTRFSLPLSAKRSLDYAAVFKERDRELSDIKYEQASLFGIAETQTIAEDWMALADTLHELADKEDEFRELVLAR